MMRSKNSTAMAVRDEDGVIRVESSRFKQTEKKKSVKDIPIIRGVFAFIDSFVGGMKTLMRSAEVFGEGEPSKFEKWTAEKLKINVLDLVITVSMILGVALAIALFIVLPQETRKGIEFLIGGGFAFDVWAKNFIEGGLKLLIFISYILFCYAIKDVRRTFMYHGAEHKTITCYERGLDLTVENAKTCKRVHDRCGTTFMVFVMVISIILFAVFEALVGPYIISGIANGKLSSVVRVLCKIALLPIVAGLSYELLKGLSKTENPVFYPLKVPGLLLQRLTTKEPTDDMLEVAIVAFKTVMELDENLEKQEEKFVVSQKSKDLLAKISKTLEDNGVTEQAEAEWIVALTAGIKRDEVNSDKLIRPVHIEKINEIVSERITGRPLWYCVGDTEFYGYTVKVDERVLIPRPETEILVEKALKSVKENSAVLDLCTGSGAIAIAIKKESGANVTAVDISGGAIEVAKQNAEINQAEIEFIKSDMFAELSDRRFDVIISNPPYIKSEDISELQTEVKDFEPMLALDGGVDGLDFYRILAEQAKAHLTEKGVILMECGIGEAQDIAEMFNGFNKVEIIKDYENIDRIVKAEV